MDAEQVANPPPAYGEPLTADQFDAKTQEGLALSAQAPQPAPVADAWETWNDDTFAAARAQSAYGQSPSSSPSAGASSSRSPPIAHYINNSNSPSPNPSPSPHNTSQTSTPARASHQRRERPPLPQIPPAQLARYQSTKQSQFQRDRKPMGARPTRGRNSQLQEISEGMALKEAERFLTSAPAWQPATSSTFEATGNREPPIASAPQQPEPVAQVSLPQQSQPIPPQPQYPTQQHANVTMHAPAPTHIITQPPAASHAHVPPSLPAIIEAPTPINDRHAALFGDNSAFSFRREDGTEDDAPPPFAPVAPTLEDVELQEAMAELQRLQLARTNPGGVIPVGSSNPMVAQEVQTSAGNVHLDASSAPAGQEHFPPQQQQLSPSGSIPASSPSPIPTHAEASSSAPAHYRHSAPPATFRPPSPRNASPSPSPVPGQGSGMTRAQSAKAHPHQPRYQPLLPPIRFNSSMAYDSGDSNGSSSGGIGLEATGAKSASDFYSASVSSTMMKVGERRPPARHRMSTASSFSSNNVSSPVSYVPRTSFSSSDPPPSSYAASTYARSQRTSFSSSDPAPAIPSMYSSEFGYAESSRSRTPPSHGPGSGGAPTVRSSSPFSVRESGPGSGGSGTGEGVGGVDDGGYDIQKQALALQQMQAALDSASPQQPQRVGGSMGMGVQRMAPSQQGGYFPHIPPPPPVVPMQQQGYQPTPPRPYAPAQNEPNRPTWVNAHLQPNGYPQQSPPHQQSGGYMYPQQQQQYAPRPIPAPQFQQHQQQQQSMQQSPMRPPVQMQVPYAQHAPQAHQRFSTMY